MDVIPFNDRNKARLAGLLCEFVWAHWHSIERKGETVLTVGVPAHGSILCLVAVPAGELRSWIEREELHPKGYDLTESLLRESDYLARRDSDGQLDLSPSS